MVLAGSRVLFQRSHVLRPRPVDGAVQVTASVDYPTVRSPPLSALWQQPHPAWRAPGGRWAERRVGPAVSGDLAAPGAALAYTPGVPSAPAEPTPDEPPPAATLEEVTSPEQALRADHDAINHRQYARTWLMLAPQFKQERYCCEADGATNSPAIAPGGTWWPLWKSSIRTSRSSSRTRRSCRPRCATPCTAAGRQRKRIASTWSQNRDPAPADRGANARTAAPGPLSRRAAWRGKPFWHDLLCCRGDTYFCQAPLRGMTMGAIRSKGSGGCHIFATSTLCVAERMSHYYV